MGDKAKWLRFSVYPTRRGCMVVVHDRSWGAGRPSSRERGRIDVALDHPLPLDDPRACLLALSDALASAADNFGS